MPVACYSRRQRGPYRGLAHVVDTGAAIACTMDGEPWIPRFCKALDTFWRDGSWIDALGLQRSPDGIAPATRRRLERAASAHPAALLEAFRLIPGFVDRAALEMTRVEARIMAAAS